jgi:hypothetical protein
MLTIASPNTSASIQLFNSSTGTGTSDGALIQMSTANLSITNLESGILTLGTNNAGRLSISSDGNISIGATSAAGNTTRYLDIYNYAAGAAASSAMRLITYDATGNAASTAIGQLVKYQTGSFLIQNTDTNAAAHIRLDVGNTERMRINSSGNVGIGTDSPLTKLQINVPSTGTTLTGTSRYGGIHLSQNNTNDEFVGITAAINNNGTQGGILFQSAGNYGTKIHFLTTDNFGTGMQNRMTLNHLGNLGIGTGGPSYTLDVVGTGRFSNSTNLNKLLIEGYGNTLAYGIQFTPANDTSAFPCRFHNAAGTLVGSIETNASTAIFNGSVVGPLTGNASTATKLATPRTINGVNFDGSANITIGQSSASGTTIPLGGIIMLTNTSSGTGYLLSTTTITQANITSAANGVYNYVGSGGNVSAGTYTVIGQSIAYYSASPLLYAKTVLVQRTS